MKLSNTSLPGVFLIEPKVFSDPRGFFWENWNAAKYKSLGISNEFVQDNISYSKHGVIRGLHFQNPKGQGKLISVLQGSIFDVAVDIRPNSPYFKQWVGFELSAENHYQLWIPRGFAHGFGVLSSDALVSYKTDDYYSPSDEQTLFWNDPEIKVVWPIKNPIISEKDLQGLCLNEFSIEKLPNI